MPHAILPRRRPRGLVLVAAILLSVVGVQTAQSQGVPATTKVLSEASTIYLSISPDGSVFTFSQLTPEIEVLAPGDVIVSGISAAAPYGFLRRVTAVSLTDGQLQVQTVAARLKDAISEGRIHVSRTLTRDQIESVSLSPGVRMLEPVDELDEVTLAEHTFAFDSVVLWDNDFDRRTNDDQITATGRLAVTISLEFDLDIGAETASLSHTVEDKLDFKIDSDFAIDIPRFSVPVARHYYTPWEIWVGIPIVIVPELSLRVGLNGELEAGASVGIEQSGYLTTGIEYAGGQIRPTGSSASRFSPVYPHAGGNLEVESFAGPRLSLLLYGPFGIGIGDIYGEVDAYLRLVVTVGVDPWWRLYGGIEVGAGASLFGLRVSAVSRVPPESLVANSGSDPLDDHCEDLDLFWLDRQSPVLWGGLEFTRDEDWATISSPADTTMLLALSLVGQADTLRRNYDLELRGSGCEAPLAVSATTRPAGEGCDADCQNGVGAWGDERIIVDLTRYGRYRSRVYGRTSDDYVENDPNADYQLAVSFGPMNSAFRLLDKTTTFDPEPAAGAPAGVMTVTLELQNATNEELFNLTFLTRALDSHHALLSATVKTKTGKEIDLDVDNAAVRGVGATVSVPNMAFCYSDVSSQCKLQEEGNVNSSDEYDDRFKITFRIGALEKQPLTAFAMDIYATAVGSVTP